ncbi:MAG TPA: hypothetical protein VK582_08945 [Pyrinomonadaceae bacterium]|nr:hypothetical protein [Pyrinomonadaceae bacterium]
MQNPTAKRRSTLPAVVARRQAGFSAEELCEMAGVCVANIKGNIHNALLRFAQQSARYIKPQIYVIARGWDAHGSLEQPMKVKLAQPCLSRQPIKVEVFGDVFSDPVCYLPKLIARKRWTTAARLFKG